MCNTVCLRLDANCLLCVQGRMPYGRTMSMEQRWQDLANLLSLPDPSHAYHHFHPPGSYPGPSYPPPDRGVLLHNATLAPPVGDLANATSYPLGQYLQALCCKVIAKQFKFSFQRKYPF